MKVHHVIPALLLLSTGAASTQHLPRPLIVNVDYRGFPFQPAFDLHPDGLPRFVWNTYANHRERLYTASFEFGRRSRTQVLSGEDGVFWSPLFLAKDTDSGWAVWQADHGSEWRIVGRRLEKGFWKPIELLSAVGRNALMPAAVLRPDDLVVAWEDHGEEPQQIALRLPDGRIENVSQVEKPCYRPVLAAGPQGELWIFWDCYERPDYAIYGRRIRPTYGPIEKISGESNALGAAAIWDEGAGLITAWVAKDDVLGKGAIDQWHRVEAAVRSGEGWSKPQQVVDLGHSLLSRIEPQVEAIWGYPGRRLHPMLVADSGAVWLLWERKINHSGRSTEPGELNGRKFNGRDWTDPVRLHENLIWYEVPGSAAARDGKLTVTGFDPMHNLYALEIDLRAGGKPLRSTELTGWKRVDLPLPHWMIPERPWVEIDGLRYYLWWGDLHVHTGLTVDAEGEVDEMMHYARDKAKLDVVVMQENDAASWLEANPQGAYRGGLLTDSEYALSVYFSRRYTEEGRFIALPGWEWSDRTDDGAPNHRTVIFAGQDTPLLRHREEDDFQALCDMVEAAGGTMLTQHAAFRLVDRPCDSNIEVASGWGIYIRRPDKIHADLSQGYKVGFVASSDGHRRNSGVGGGMTGIWAPELTSRAILESLQKRRVYATNGSRMILEARANGVFMGRDVDSEGEVTLSP